MPLLYLNVVVADDAEEHYRQVQVKLDGSGGRLTVDVFDADILSSTFLGQVRVKN